MAEIDIKAVRRALERVESGQAALRWFRSVEDRLNESRSDVGGLADLPFPDYLFTVDVAAGRGGGDDATSGLRYLKEAVDRSTLLDAARVNAEMDVAKAKDEIGRLVGVNF